jgi:hypothetical protein
MLPPALAALDEYGLPLQLVARLEPLLPASSDLDSVLSALRTLDNSTASTKANLRSGCFGTFRRRSERSLALSPSILLRKSVFSFSASPSAASLPPWPWRAT